MSPTLYACTVCGTHQPIDTEASRSADDADPPSEIRNVTCRHKFGGCCRMASMERVDGREWNPARWELFCLRCEYETVAWGAVGFGDTGRWACPECDTGMQVLDVSHADEATE